MDESTQKKPVGKNKKRSRRLASMLFLLGVAMLLLHNVLTDYAYGVSAPDGIYIPNSRHRFSGQKAGDVVSHTFRIYNLRPRILKVEAQPDCGCTGLSWKSAAIPPFGWRNLTARMSVGTTNSTEPKSVGIALSTSSSVKKWAFVYLAA